MAVGDSSNLFIKKEIWLTFWLLVQVMLKTSCDTHILYRLNKIKKLNMKV